MLQHKRSFDDLNSRFGAVYDRCIVGRGFFESDEYYRIEKGRYLRSLELFCELDINSPAQILEIGGGQLALLCKKLFGDEATVGDVSCTYMAPLQREGINFITFDLMRDNPNLNQQKFDIIFLLEVIEHIPQPAHAVIERIKPLLKPNGVLFLTTPNLFRLRNLIRMFMGVEFFDHFTLPEPGHGLGHQIEYSANHLRWQLQRSGMEVVMLKHETLGRTGHSLKARLARKVLAPLLIRQIWRDSLVAAARIA